MIDSFICSHAHRGARERDGWGVVIYVASDEAAMIEEMRRAYRGHSRVRVVAIEATRSNGKAPVHIGGRFQHQGDSSLARDVILETLLLAKASYLIKTASAVSEMAIYLNPALLNHSYDFSLDGQPMPLWAAHGTERPPMVQHVHGASHWCSSAL